MKSWSALVVAAKIGASVGRGRGFRTLRQAAPDVIRSAQRIALAPADFSATRVGLRASARLTRDASPNLGGGQLGANFGLVHF